MSDAPTMTLKQAVNRLTAGVFENISEARDAIAWYADLIERLPKDAEGVPVAPSDALWLVYRSANGQALVIASDYDDLLAWRGCNGDRPDDWIGVFTQLAAAEAAAKGARDAAN